MGDPPTKADRRGIGAVFAFETCAALLVLVWHRDLMWWSITLQVFGALLASGGLLWSYLRATRFWERRWPKIKAQLRRFLGMGSGNQVIRPTGATMGTFGFQARVRVSYNLDHALPVEDQIAQLERFISRLMDEEIKPINDQIVKLQDGLREARSLAESKAEEALSEARTEIAALAQQMDRTQAFDIRWAIGGLFISAVGTFLQYWT